MYTSLQQYIPKVKSIISGLIKNIPTNHETLQAIFKPFFAGLFYSMYAIVKNEAQSANDAPIRLAVAGITHGHAPLILDKAGKGKTDVVLVGIYEPNKDLARQLRMAACYA